MSAAIYAWDEKEADTIVSLFHSHLSKYSPLEEYVTAHLVINKDKDKNIYPINVLRLLFPLI